MRNLYACKREKNYLIIKRKVLLIRRVCVAKAYASSSTQRFKSGKDEHRSARCVEKGITKIGCCPSDFTFPARHPTARKGIGRAKLDTYELGATQRQCNKTPPGEPSSFPPPTRRRLRPRLRKNQANAGTVRVPVDCWENNSL